MTCLECNKTIQNEHNTIKKCDWCNLCWYVDHKGNFWRKRGLGISFKDMWARIPSGTLYVAKDKKI